MAAPEPPAGGDSPDFSAQLEDLSRRIAEAERYLGIERLRFRRQELEAEAARPDLWDDADRARSITTELGKISGDLEGFDQLETALGDARVLDELVGDAEAAGSPDAGLAKELHQVAGDLEEQVGQLELRSLLSGDYDEFDAIAEVHA